MKKHTIYQTMRPKKGRKPFVVETEGYLYSITGPCKTTMVALVYKRPYWFATHYESGMDCTPHKGRSPLAKHWTKREELLEALSKIPFGVIEDTELAKNCTQLVQRYKEKKNNHEILDKKA